MAKPIPMASGDLCLWLMPMYPAHCYHFMELLDAVQKKKIQHGLNAKGQEGNRPGEGRGATLGTASLWAGCNNTWGRNTP